MFNVICVPVLIRSCRFAAAINPVMRRFSQSAPNYSPNKTMTKKFPSPLFLFIPTIDYTHECPKIKEPHLPSFKKCFKQTTTYITRVGTKYTTTDQQQQQAPIPVPVPVRHRNTHPLGRRNYSTITQSRW